MIAAPRIRANICLDAHPVGCGISVAEQINYIKNQKPVKGPKNVLVVGSSTGYGLASRITAAFGCKANTVGVFFEKEGTETKSGTSGFYNNRYFEEAARNEGLIAESINGDAFSHEIKAHTGDIIAEKMGKIDFLVYSLASPVRTDPDTGIRYKSALKPIGEPYTAKKIDIMSGDIEDITLEKAESEDIENTIKVMGGEDWKLWIQNLRERDLLADNFVTVAYSYIGPTITYPIYREGTIGKAKEHLENTAKQLNSELSAVGGKAFVSINKALITKASAVIPAVPIYISLLYKVMKEKGLHEGAIEQMYRLFNDFLFSNGEIKLDEEDRIRIDDWEMREDVQSEVLSLWKLIKDYDLAAVGDLEGCREDFLHLNGLGYDQVDYSRRISFE